MAQLTNCIQIEFINRIDELDLGIIAIYDQVFDLVRQISGISTQMFGIKVNPGYLIRLLLTITLDWSLTSYQHFYFLLGRCLPTRKAIARVIRDINHGQIWYFQPFGCLVVATVVEETKPIRFLATFGDKWTIQYRYLLVITGHSFFNELFVKIGKVKGLAKLTWIGLFVQITIATHIPKVDFAAHQQNCQEQGHHEFLLRLRYTWHFFQYIVDEIFDFYPPFWWRIVVLNFYVK